MKKIRENNKRVALDPQWLLATETGVETYASSENILRKFNSEFCEGDPFLGSGGWDVLPIEAEHRELQLETFCLCPGDSIIAALATGEGKALFFS